MGNRMSKQPVTNGSYLGGSIINVGWVRHAVCAVTHRIYRQALFKKLPMHLARLATRGDIEIPAPYFAAFNLSQISLYIPIT
jgi:hypothetical protein